ncbi:MAG: type II toxin-antitoxin system RelE/ParE family toxin [Rhodospirillales bacterium]|nr:type II toxin-antitoxin system RelE/ParE family toxin [Rhodospirillales bacterium]
MARVLQTPTFKRAVKRLRERQKQELDSAVRAIAANPTIGESKLGDLAGVRVYKFAMGRQRILLSHEFFEEDGIVKLLALGGHENFYRDLNS